MSKYICLLKNSLAVGFISTVIGLISLYLIDLNDKISIKTILIFFGIGLAVHIVLEYFNFNQLCCDKQCYSLMCLIK
jgi:hypothetical protein